MMPDYVRAILIFVTVLLGSFALGFAFWFNEEGHAHPAGMLFFASASCLVLLVRLLWR